MAGEGVGVGVDVGVELGVGVLRLARERSRAVRCGAFCGLGSGRLGQVGG